MLMGKDREGSFHPPKGKPSGSGKEEGVGLNNPFSGSVEEYQELADKYTSGDSEAPANVKVRHPNRNVNKAEEKKADKNSNRNRPKRNRSQISNDEQAPAAPQELPGVLTKELFE